MHYGPEIGIVVIVCFALVVGATMRMFAASIRVPHTIAMLTVGLAVGLLIEKLHAAGSSNAVLELLARGSMISPGLILFVFLPVLVFESAFALEVHTLRKNVGAVLMLSGPALLMSTGLIGLLMVELTQFSWQWGWLPALAFGALISATDPVAVVALMRELGAPKRLGLLVEGESLLNDGTAIVVFSLLVGLLTGAQGFEPAGIFAEFLSVTGGGLVVGLLLAAAVTGWLSRTFNVPLVEITLTLVLAYLAMLVAEGFLHVSGVIAVVAAGLWMSARGRLQISPEVMHFLRRFWEMLAYLANTLIFFLVGLVTATQIGDAGTRDFLVIGVGYAGIVTVRFFLILLFRPLMNRVADPIDLGDAAVISWGGMRGAVSLALALVVSQHPDVPQELGRQILLTTAGVVLLTILVNGSTMAWLLRRLGLDRPEPGDRLTELVMHAALLERVRNRIAEASDSRDLRTVNWVAVRGDIDAREVVLLDEIASARRELEAGSDRDRARGYWRRALSIERESYWASFSKGMLGAEATRILDHEIDLQLDRLSRGAERPAAERVREPQSYWARLVGWVAGPGRFMARQEFATLALRYDLCRGEQLAAERVLEDLAAHSEIDEDVRDEMQRTYLGYLHASKERLEDLRVQLPEVTRAIETQLARRIQLNFEREGYEEFERVGAVAPVRAAEARAEVERHMKELHRSEIRMALPETGDLCRGAPLFKDLDEDGMRVVCSVTLERTFAPDEILFRQGDPGASMFIVARGAVAIVRERSAADGDETELLDILGGGDILGEMALLTGAPRIATARALTTVIVGEISAADFRQLMATQPGLREGIWKGFGERLFDNLLRTIAAYEHMSRADRIDWFRRGRLVSLQEREGVRDDSARFVFVVTGMLECAGENHGESSLVELPTDAPLTAQQASLVVLLHSPFQGSAREP